MIKGVQISDATALALHSMVIISIRKELTNANTISKIIKGSKAHIAKVLQKLTKEGLIKSTRGPKGGFELNKHPRNISLLNIYEAIEGKLEIRTCMFNNPFCIFGTCMFGNLLGNIGKKIHDYFVTNTLEDIQNIIKSDHFDESRINSFYEEYE